MTDSSTGSSTDAALARRAAQVLRGAGERLNNTPALLGFDGFIDTILHVVDQRISSTEYSRVATLGEYGRRIAAAAGQSTNVEVVVQDVKLGGNGPIMANALAALGLPVTYCGMTGHPHTHPVFEDFAHIAHLLPLAEPALTDAYEFDDGKLIVGKHATVAEVSYDTLVARVGEDTWAAAWDAARFVGMVNWTMLPHLTALWKTLRQYSKSNASGNASARKTLFFDLADPEKRTTEDLLDGLQTLAAFSSEHDVILGLNEKEGIQVAAALQLSDIQGDDPHEVVSNTARAIRDKLGIAACVIHPTAFAAASNGQATTAVVGPWTPKPKISTGAGDHFNAGFCLGLLAGGTLDEALQCGVGTSGFYVRNASSPSRLQLAAFLEELAEEAEAEAK
jgi:sugar/nucleoside kinase (ribokinase family)